MGIAVSNAVFVNEKETMALSTTSQSLDPHGLRCQGRTPPKNQRLVDDDVAAKKPEAHKKPGERNTDVPVSQHPTAITSTNQQRRLDEGYLEASAP